MRVNLKKIFVIFFVCIFIGAVSYAHSGRTDSSRGIGIIRIKVD